ncbi:hypothetical protein DDB_G0288413 [Dictyostelium discoideum AX4]|uniref:Uncharacterized protein n=1 Tax=Dictyostelium discoideum TaxID=44689 RepID=Q54IZ2_DICDI|nr:hypothetical protein DDB_G0288413 [Dictyostelium discoideum AX4]EAL63232.1 hypothetical protein DDB_G0288413 [Dictyostelium discoideum AX4]|eukprot:XP_636738.1 hypothetical protein DDB_G0288413 [Dictyostelium discoideum AX4]
MNLDTFYASNYEHFSCYNNFKYLDSMLKNVKDNEIFFRAIVIAVANSRLHILEFLNEKCGDLVKEIKNYKGFNFFLNQEFPRDNVRVSEFLLQLINQADSEKLFGQKSLLYFK